MSMNEQRGAGILEIILVMAIVAMLAPFAFMRISEVSENVRNMGAARQILDARNMVSAFVRMNSDSWPEVVQIKLSDEDLNEMAPGAHAGFVDKYSLRGSVIVDVYLAYNVGDALRASRIALDMGSKNAAVIIDGVAYGDTWAVAGEDFGEGDLVMRVNRSNSAIDRSKYLHRGTDGEDGLNVMHRNLNMGLFDIYAVGRIVAESVKALEASTGLISTNSVSAEQVYFSRGATMDGGAVKFGNVRVTGDMTGFRTIAAARLNSEGFGTDGTISTDRATINRALHIGKELILKSSGTRTISGFAGMSVHSLLVPFLSVGELEFMNDFGLVVSSELLLSYSDYPLKLGAWKFPGTRPKFSSFSMARATITGVPDAKAFDKMTEKKWKDRRQAN